MHKFTSFKNWLNEQKEKEEVTYGCVMLGTNMRDWEDIHTGGIDHKDVYRKPLDDSFGLEEDPHMTVLYGIHEDQVDPEIIMNVIENNMEEVTVTITNISIFETEEYDVVKYDIPVTEQILKYREMFADNFENTQTFPEYHPHMTIAYVKPGEGEKYVSDLDEPFEVTFSKAIYSFHKVNDEGEVELLTKKYVFKRPEEEEYEL